MLLFELNLTNIEQVEKYAEQVTSGVENQAAKKWLYAALRKYLINDEAQNSKISSLTPNAPEWMKQKFKEKVPLYRFSPNADLTEKMSHIVDWLNSIEKVSKEPIQPNAPKAQAKQQLANYANKILSSLNQVDLKTLLAPKQEKQKHHVEDWFDALNKLVQVDKNKEQEKDIPEEQKSKRTIEYDNGSAWVSLKSQQALDVEGKLMGHCVGGYCNKVLSGGTQIFSLRDNEDEPHVTIELTNNEIQQVKGKQNAPPVAKYVPYVKDFLNKSKFPANKQGQRDIEKMGLMYNDATKKYGLAKEIYPKVYSNEAGYEFYKGKYTESYYDKNDAYYAYHGNNLVLILMKDPYNENGYKLLSFEKNDDKEKNKTEQEKVYGIAIDFLNHLGEEYDLSNANQMGYARKDKSDKKFYKINDLTPIDNFSDGVKVYKIYADDDNEFLFFYNNKKIASLEEGSMKFYSIEIYNKFKTPEFKKEMLDFLNVFITNPKDPMTGNLLSELDIIRKEDGKFSLFTDAADVVQEFPDNSKLYKFKDIYRLYSSNNEQIIAQWRVLGFGNYLNDFEVEDQNLFRKYASSIVQYFNVHKISMSDTSSRYHIKAFKDKLGQYGILWQRGKWTTAKQKGVGTDISIEKLTSKKSNVVERAVGVIGNLEFSSANVIDNIRAFVNAEGMLQFLYDYQQKNPKLIFSNDLSHKTDLKKFGYLVKNGKLTLVSKEFPEQRVLEVEDGITWVKGAKFLDDDELDSYKYALQNADGKNVMVVYLSEGDPNRVKSITLLDRTAPGEASKEMDYSPVNMAPMISAFTKLVEKENLKVSQNVLTNGGMMVKDGKIQSVSDNPKLEGFIKGKIVYDNGVTWQREHRRGYRETSTWELIMPKSEAPNIIKNDNTEVLSCNVDDTGISRISVNIKIPKLYRKYVNDMMDIVEELNGEAEESE